jgi:hypothetical protein
LQNYLDTILALCKPISEVGAEQLLLDTHALRTGLMEISTIGTDKTILPSFSKILNDGIMKIERLLKVVLRPSEPPSGIIETYLHLYSNHDCNEFLNILELKAIRKLEINMIIEEFKRKAPQARPLSSDPNEPVKKLKNDFLSFMNKLRK